MFYLIFLQVKKQKFRKLSPCKCYFRPSDIRHFYGKLFKLFINQGYVPPKESLDIIKEIELCVVNDLHTWVNRCFFELRKKISQHFYACYC